MSRYVLSAIKGQGTEIKNEYNTCGTIKYLHMDNIYICTNRRIENYNTAARYIDLRYRNDSILTKYSI